jgi:hypothetical protein
MENDPGSPEIIQEIIDAGDEWGEVQDIVALTFKAVCHVLRVQHENFKDM